MAKFQDMPFGELTKAICAAMGAVKEGAFNGLVTGIADGLVTQRVNRDGATVRHDVMTLSAVVKEGDVVDIQYLGGVGVVKGVAKDLGMGR